MRLVREHSFRDTSRMGSARSKHAYRDGACNVQQQYPDEEVRCGSTWSIVLIEFCFFLRQDGQAAQGESERAVVQCLQEDLPIVRQHAHPQANPQL